MAQVQGNRVVLTGEELIILNNFVANRQYGEAYEYVAGLLRFVEQAGILDPDQYDPLPEQYQSVMLWFEGAALVNLAENSGDSGFADLIRFYSSRQTELHFNRAIDPFGGQMQDASNAVATNAIDSIVRNNGLVPLIEQIAIEDASAIGRELFNDDIVDTAFTRNSAWSGTVLFPLLGSDQTGLLLQDRNSLEQNFNNLEDLRNLLFTVDSFNYAMQQAVGNASFSSVWRDMFPTGISTFWNSNNKSGLVSSLTSGVFDNNYEEFLLEAVAGGVAESAMSYVISQDRYQFVTDLSQLFGLGSTPVTQSNFVARASSVFSSLETNSQLSLTIVRLDTLSADELASRAESSIAYRYALANLNAFVVEGDDSIFTIHNTNGELNLTSFSEEYLQDRSLMLHAQLQMNTDDSPHPEAINGEPVYFRDEDAGVLFAGGNTNGQGGSNTLDRDDVRNILFDNDEANTLTGRGFNDHLYGAAGDDTLDGGQGNDYLEGGTGNDTYRFDYGDGRDVISDHGASGDINRLFVTHTSGGTQEQVTRIELVQGTTNVYAEFEADSNTFRNNTRYTVITDPTNPTQQNLLINVDGGNGGQITIANWNPASFDVQVDTPEAPTRPEEPTGNFDYANQIISYIDGLPDVGSSGPARTDSRFWGANNLRSDLFRMSAYYQYGETPLTSSYTTDSFSYSETQTNNGYEYDPISIQGDPNFEYYDTPYLNDVNFFFDAEQWRAFFSNPSSFGSESDISSSLSSFFINTLANEANGYDTYLTYGYTGWEQYLHIGFTGGDQDDYLLGHEAGTDDFKGNQGNDVLLGLGGDDYLDGSLGSDWVEGGSGDDFLWGNAQFNWRNSDSPKLVNEFFTDDGELIREYLPYGTYLYEEANTVDYLDGGAGNDFVSGGQGADIIIGGEGDDNLYGNVGNDSIFGDANNDVILGDSYFDNFELFTYSQFVGRYLSGIYYLNDVIAGYDYDDILSGGEGNDSLYGELGSDTLLGGQGNDLLHGGRPAGLFYEENVYDPEGGLVDTVRYESDALDPLLDGSDTLLGGDGDDTLIGSAGGDTLFGGNDNDNLIGDNADNEELAVEFHGDDYLDGGAGNDFLRGGGGNDQLYGGSGVDTLLGDDSTIRAEDHGDDVLDGGEGNDELAGQGGNDVLLGGAGNDVIYGDDQNNTLAGQHHGQDTIDGGAGDDTIFGGGDNDIIRGGVGNDIIYGDDRSMAARYQGDDTIDGGSGDDVIHAGAGDDVLVGGSGVDLLRGGKGNDTYIINAGDASERSASGSADSIVDTEGNNTLVLNGTSIGDLVIQIYTDLVNIRYGSSSVLAMDAATFDAMSNFTVSGRDYTRVELIENLSINNRFIRDPDRNLMGAIDPNLNESLRGASGDDIIVGGSGNNTLTGAYGNDSLEGGLGTDILSGGTGNDTLSGGQGENDRLIGNEGSDTYLFALGDGDTLIDNHDISSGRNDVLLFSGGISPTDVMLSRSQTDGVNDLLITLTGSGETIRVLNFFVSEEHEINEIRFTDDTTTVWSGSSLKPTIVTTESTDYIVGYIDNDTINGLGGDDTLFGLAGDDTIDGGSGDDLIYGGEGNDELSGGTGSDILVGQEGNDTYVFTRGDGNTAIYNHAEDINSNDRIRFVDVGPADVEVVRNENNLEINVIATREVITIVDFFEGESYEIDSILFPGDVEWDNATIKQLSLGGTSGDDILEGTAINDTVDGLAGHDVIRGGEGADTIQGGLGSDSLYGDEGDDTLSGGQGSDELHGGEGNDTLQASGGDGNRLYGGAGDDTLRGSNDISPVSTGDFLDGGAGNDVYLFARGDNSITIDNFDDSHSRYDVLRFVGDITPEDISFERSLGGLRTDLLITIAGTAQTITLSNFFFSFDESGLDDNYAINAIEFSNGSVWSTSILRERVLLGSDDGDTIDGYITNDYINGQAGDDVLRGNGGSDTLVGGDGDDQLSGGEGDDVLSGGVGNDILRGGQGSDVYRYSIGDGNITINNNNDTFDTSHGWRDVLRFDSGINPDEIKLSRNSGGDLLVSYLASGDVITVVDHFSNDRNVLHAIEFADGTIWEAAEIETLLLTPTRYDDTIYGSSQDETISGAEGEDYLSGGEGSDTLNGDQGDDVLLGQGGTDTIYGGVGNDALYGDNTETNSSSGDADTLYGGWGADRLYGGGGNDTLSGGKGDGDILDGGRGDDTYHYSLGDGDTVINAKEYHWLDRYSDTLQFDTTISPSDVRLSRTLHTGSTNNNERINEPSVDLLITVVSSGETILLEEYFLEDYITETTTSYASTLTIRFSNGDTWNEAYVRSTLLSEYTVNDDIIAGDENANTLLGGLGDDRIFGYGGDDILEGGVGSDRLDGGDGHDTLRAGNGGDKLVLGGRGNDTYEFRAGDSTTRIVTVSSLYPDTNQYEVISFAEGINPDEVRFHRSNNDLLIASPQLYGLITVSNFYISESHEIDSVQFATGETLDATAIKSMAESTPYSELQIGSPLEVIPVPESGGNGSVGGLPGAGGFTVPLPGPDVTYPPTLQITDVNSGDVIASRSGDNFVMFVPTTGDTMTIAGFFRPDYLGIQSVQFTDDVIWNSSDIRELVITGTAADDQLEGYSTDDTIHGGQGDDNITGGMGEDDLHGGHGTDRLYGGQGRDTLRGGTGDRDYLEGGYGEDTYLFGLGDGDTRISTYTDSTPEGTQDTLRFLEGIAPEDVRYSRGGASYNSLFLEISTTGETVEVEQFFASTDRELRSVEFVDNPDFTFNLEEIRANLLATTPNDDHLYGYSAVDTISGGVGDDQIYGYQGNDTLYGGIGADLIHGGADNDVIYGGAGDDSNTISRRDSNGNFVNHGLYGADGDDTIYGGSGNDYLSGGTDRDHLYGDSGDDLIDGGDGNDHLYGGSGSDDLRGGDGDDTFYGGADTEQDYYTGGRGNDTYHFSLGEGNLLITQFSNSASADYDRLVFSAEINPDDVELFRREEDRFSFNPIDLVLRISSTGEEITIYNHFGGTQYELDAVEFANGVVWTPTDFAAALPYQAPNTTLENADELVGSLGNDTLTGTASGEVLLGSYGNDTLQGNGGSDIYLFGYGHGQDTIINNDTDTSSVDILQFQSDINVSDVVFSQQDLDLIVLFPYSTDSVTVRDYFASDNAQFGIIFESDPTLFYQPEDIQSMLAVPSSSDDVLYGDDSSADSIDGLSGDDRLYGLGGADQLSGGEGHDSIYGGADNDTLEGGEGDDYLRGGLGQDIYVFNLGDGYDTIYNHEQTTQRNDILSFDEGISISDLNLLWMPSNVFNNTFGGTYDLLINFNHSSDAIYVQAPWDMQFQFSNGDTLAASEIYTLAEEQADVVNIREHTILSDGLQNVRYSNVEVSGNTNPSNFISVAEFRETFGFLGRNRVYSQGDSRNNIIVGSGSLINEIDGGEGADLMFGGAQSDIYFVDNEGDRIQEGYGIPHQYTGSYENKDLVVSSIDYVLPDEVEHIYFEGSGASYGAGNGGNNIIYATNSVMTLEGREGDDVYVVNNDDTIIEAADQGSDTIVLVDDDVDILRLDSFNNIENAKLVSNGGALIGDENANSLYAARYDARNHFYQAFLDTDIGRAYQLKAYIGDFNGYIGNYIDGSPTAWTRSIDGGAGDDHIYGDVLANTIIGGLGDDYLAGGEGGDSYHYSMGQGNDTIYERQIASGTDRVIFDQFVDRADVSFERDPENSNVLLVHVGVGTIRIQSAIGENNVHVIEQYIFADGTVLTPSDVQYLLSGNSTPEVDIDIFDQFVQAGQTFNFTIPDVTFSDADGDSLTIGATLPDGSDLPSWLSFDATTLNFSGTPAAGDSDVTIRVTASDGNGGTAISDFTFVVENSGNNAAPIVATAITDQTATEDTAFSFAIPSGTFTDADGDTLSLSATLSDGSALPSWLSFDAATQTFSGTPAEGDGDITVRVTASDGNGGTVSDDFALSITDVNDAPIVATAITDQTATEDTAFSFAIPAGTFTDADGDILSFSATLSDGSVLPSWLSFDAATQTFSGTPLEGDGDITVRVTASDGNGGIVSDDFALSITDVNDAPVVSVAISDQTATEDTAFSFAIPAGTFTDADGDTLSLSATLSDGSALPSWLSFDAATQTFSGTPAEGDGDITIRVTASDGNGGTVSDDFALSITDVNDAPIVATAITDQTATEDTAFSFAIPAGTFMDADGDTLSLSATLSDGSALPSWLSFDAATQTFSGTPADGDSDVTVRVTASDGNGGTVSDDFVLAINDAPSGVSEIRGTSGDDTLTATSADELLLGLGGNDTYEYGLGDGSDQVVDASGTLDRILFGSGISLDNIELERSDDNVIVRITGTDDQLQIDNAFNRSARSFTVDVAPPPVTTTYNLDTSVFDNTGVGIESHGIVPGGLENEGGGSGGITWNDLRGTAADSDGDITKTTGDNWDSGYFDSLETLAANTDGWIEFAASTLSSQVVGLGNAALPAQHLFEEIDYQMWLQENGSVLIIEQGEWRASVGSYAAGDTFRIERQGGVITYSQNGQPLYSSILPSTGELRLEGFLYNGTAQISDVTASFAEAAAGDGYYTVSAGETWSEIALAVYGTEAVADELEAAFPGVDLATTDRLDNFPATLDDDEAIVTVPDFYTVPDSISNWDDLAEALYGATDNTAAVATQLQTLLEPIYGTDPSTIDEILQSDLSTTISIDVQPPAESTVVELVADAFDTAGEATSHDLIEDAVETPEGGGSGGITWNDLRGTAVDSDGDITKTTGDNWDNGYFDSLETLAANTDGWIEFTASTLSSQVVGLGNAALPAQHLFEEIDYQMWLQENGSVLIIEQGEWRASVGSYAAGDTFRIERQGGVITYSQNGQPLYTSTLPSTGELRLEGFLYNGTAEISDVTASFAEDSGGEAYYAIQADDTWESIAQTLYGNELVADELAAAFPGTDLRTTDQLTSLPASLTNTNPADVAPYYAIPAGATWETVATDLYGSSAVSSQLQAVLEPLGYNLADDAVILQSDLEINPIELFELASGETYTLSELLASQGLSINGDDSDETLEGSDYNDTLAGARGNDQLNGGLGSDQYTFASGDGSDTIVDSGGNDALSLSDATAGDLWFEQLSNDLRISILGSTDSVTVENWFDTASDHQIETITAGTETLRSSNVLQLVQAMAVFGPVESGEITLTAEEQAQVDTAIAESWA